MAGCLDMVRQFDDSIAALPDANKTWNYLQPQQANRHGQHVASRAPALRATDVHGRSKRVESTSGKKRRRKVLVGEVPPKLAAAANAAAAKVATTVASLAPRPLKKKRSTKKNANEESSHKKRRVSTSTPVAPIVVHSSGSDDDESEDAEASYPRPPDVQMVVEPPRPALSDIPANIASALAEATRMRWDRQDQKLLELQKKARQRSSSSSSAASHSPPAFALAHRARVTASAASVSSVSSRGAGVTCRYCDQDLSKLKVSAAREQHIVDCRERSIRHRESAALNM